MCHTHTYNSLNLYLNVLEHALAAYSTSVENEKKNAFICIYQMMAPKRAYFPFIMRHEFLSKSRFSRCHCRICFVSLSRRVFLRSFFLPVLTITVQHHAVRCFISEALSEEPNRNGNGKKASEIKIVRTLFENLS